MEIEKGLSSHQWIIIIILIGVLTWPIYGSHTILTWSLFDPYLFLTWSLLDPLHGPFLSLSRYYFELLGFSPGLNFNKNLFIVRPSAGLSFVAWLFVSVSVSACILYRSYPTRPRAGSIPTFSHKLPVKIAPSLWISWLVINCLQSGMNSQSWLQRARSRSNCKGHWCIEPFLTCVPPEPIC